MIHDGLDDVLYPLALEAAEKHFPFLSFPSLPFPSLPFPLFPLKEVILSRIVLKRLPFKTPFSLLLLNQMNWLIGLR